MTRKRTFSNGALDKFIYKKKLKLKCYNDFDTIIYNKKMTEQDYIDNEVHFQKFPFALDDFQKKAIICINKEENVLVTAHTGSGKTVVANYGIMDCISHNKKVIYTSPIKSLSNQKYHEFKKKYPDNSVGIITGDVKFNPQADILIMTTEILRNILFGHNVKDKDGLDTNVNIDENVGTVIFDEIHYINDAERGKVWEQTIMMLPKHIKLILLSATIDRANEFADWIQTVRERKINLISTFKRHVPLKHYYYLFEKNINPKKQVKTKKGVTQSRPTYNITNKLVSILDENGIFGQDNYNKMLSTKMSFQNTLNIFGPLSDFLITNNLCPAIFFVFSRRKCEQFAGSITKCLIDYKEQDKIKNIVRQQIHKLPDYEKYLKLEQYQVLMKMLDRGIAIHHSGLVPIFKELIEILFSEHLIKILFATETLAVGVNMPTRTVLFTELGKRDNNGFRMLLPHEYVQMAGRAGRRGIDTVGHVIHLPNLYDDYYVSEVKSMMCGKSQYIQSKFTIDYQFVLTFFGGDIDNVTKNSLLNKELNNNIAYLTKCKEEMKKELDNCELVGDDDIGLFESYTKILNANPQILLTREQQKSKNAFMATVKSTKDFNIKYEKYLEGEKKRKDYESVVCELESNITFVQTNIDAIIDILTDTNYISNNVLTVKGIIAKNIHEVNSVLLTELIVGNFLNDLTLGQCASVLSIFLNTRIEGSDDLAIESVNVGDKVKNIVKEMQKIADHYMGCETKRNLYTNTEWTLYLGMMCTSELWGDGYDMCDLNLPTFDGTFIKDMIKLSSICDGVIKIAEFITNNDLILKIMELQKNLMRDIVSSDSLYIL